MPAGYIVRQCSDRAISTDWHSQSQTHRDQTAIVAIPEEVLVDVDMSPCEKIAA